MGGAAGGSSYGGLGRGRMRPMGPMGPMRLMSPVNRVRTDESESFALIRWTPTPSNPCPPDEPAAFSAAAIPPSGMSGYRWLWIDGQPAGPYSENQIHRLLVRGEVISDTLYWHEASEEWRPLTRYLDDLHAEQLDEIRRSGHPKVEFVAGRTEEECPVCQALHGRRFLIKEAPKIPPEGCTCEPWSQATYAGVH